MLFRWGFFLIRLPWPTRLAIVGLAAPGLDFRENGYCYFHVQAIMLAVDQYAETALGNREYFLNKPHSIGGRSDNIPQLCGQAKSPDWSDMKEAANRLFESSFSPKSFAKWVLLAFCLSRF
jgi:hypothetical protein